MPNFINLSSDEDEEDEELPFLQSKTSAAKVGKRLRRAGSGSKSVPSDEDDSPWLKRKIRRVEATSGVTTRAEVHRTPPRATRSSSKTPPRTAKSTFSKGKHTSNRYNNAPIQDKNTPNRGKKPPPDTRKPTRKVVIASRSAKTSSTSTPPSHVPSLEAISVADVPIPSPSEKPQGGGQESVESISPATKPAPNLASGQPKNQEPVTQSTNAPSNVVEAIPQPQSAAQEPAVPQTVAPLSEELALSELPSQPPVSKIPDPVVKNTSAQPRVQVPDALRSAIAQVVSQRQELLNSRWGRRQTRSDSEYAPSDGDDDEDDGEKCLEEDSDSTNKDSKRRNPAKDNAPATRSNRDTTDRSSHRNIAQVSAERSAPRVQDASGVDSSPGVPRSRNNLTAGHIPPLLNLPRTISGETNLERKRTFFHAKKLAFEQFESICEGELQQLEVELLRREMETRESFAQKEIQLQRMNIRAEVIQRMVLAGASVAEISERLTLL